MSQEMYQTVIFVLSDGREIRASVPAFWDGKNDVAVRSVKVTEAKPMPKGYYFEAFDLISDGEHEAISLEDVEAAEAAYSQGVRM